MPACSRQAAARRPHGGPRHDTGGELVEVEGLAEVVVGPAVQAGDPIRDAVTGRQQDNRGPVVPSSQAAQHVEAGAVRQHQVEHDDAEPARGERRVGVGAGGDALDRRSRQTEPGPQAV